MGVKNYGPKNIYNVSDCVYHVLYDKTVIPKFYEQPLNNNDFYLSLRVEESDRDFQLNMSLKRPLQHNLSCLEIGLQYM